MWRSSCGGFHRGGVHLVGLDEQAALVIHPADLLVAQVAVHPLDQRVRRSPALDAALGGINSTLNHGNLQASGIDVIALGPKFSISILGREAFQSSAEIEKVAKLTAKDAGSFNMESCGSSRFHFVQASPGQAMEYARRLYDHMQLQDPALSTIPKDFPSDLQHELQAARAQDDFYYVVGGDKQEGAVVASG